MLRSGVRFPSRLGPWIVRDVGLVFFESGNSYFLNCDGGIIRLMSKPTKDSKREVRRIRHLSAWIMVQGRVNSECQVLDVSKSGAKLVAPTSSAVPDRFDLAFFQGDQPRGCEVIWRHGKVLGVKFTQ
jgi:hypothetical protein